MANLLDPHTESSAQIDFELICATLEDYEHLPELVPGSAERPRRIDRDGHADAIDAEILAGLVRP